MNKINSELKEMFDKNILILRKLITYLFWLFIEDLFLIPAAKRNIELRKNNRNMFFEKLEFGMKKNNIY